MTVVIEAERNLRYQLSYSSKYTFLSRLMRKFHKALFNDAAVKARLEQVFADTKAAFLQVPEFSGFVTGLQDEFADLTNSMTHRLGVDFEAHIPANFFQALQVQASENGHARALDEMGTGEQQVLAMAFAHAYARTFHDGIVLVVEEPESHLHPLAPKWLASRLNAMCADGLQVILTTHSAAFVDVLNFEGSVIARKVGGATQVIQKSVGELIANCERTGVPAGRMTEANALPFHAANSTREILEGLFAKAVVLVEGPTESLSLPEYFLKAGLNGPKEGVCVVSVNGNGNLAKWRRFFDTFGVPTYIVFDNDNEDDRQGRKRQDTLTSLGIPAGDHAGILAGDAWVVQPTYTVFGEDFERSLGARFTRYAAAETDAVNLGVDSKPFVARHVANTLAYDQGPEWDRIREMVQAVKAIAQ